MKKTTEKTLAKASNKKPLIRKGVKMAKPDFMKKFEMTPNLVIGNRDAKIWVYGTIQAVIAKPAIKATEAVKAVKEVKAEPSKIVNGKTQPEVKAVAPVAAVKAVKAQDAVKAVPQKWKGIAIGNTKKIVNELIARLGDQGFYPEDEGKQHGIDDVKFCAEYVVEDVKGFRTALKLCKSAGKYNDPGLKLLAEKGKAQKEKEKAAEKKAKAAAKGKETINGKKEKESAPKEKTKDEGADWPTPE